MSICVWVEYVWKEIYRTRTWLSFHTCMEGQRVSIIYVHNNKTCSNTVSQCKAQQVSTHFPFFFVFYLTCPGFVFSFILYLPLQLMHKLIILCFHHLSDLSELNSHLFIWNGNMTSHHNNVEEKRGDQVHFGKDRNVIVIVSLWAAFSFLLIRQHSSKWCSRYVCCHIWWLYYTHESTMSQLSHHTWHRTRTQKWHWLFGFILISLKWATRDTFVVYSFIWTSHNLKIHASFYLLIVLH